MQFRTLETRKERFHDATGTGALGTASTGVKARVSSSAAYYDLADRPTDSVDVGTNAAAAYARPATVPARSDTVLVSSTTYDAAGRAFEVTDPRGLKARTIYDALGRVTKTVENYVDGVPSNLDDKTTEFTYSAAGRTSLTARLAGGGGQTTAWVYGATTAAGSAVNSNDVLVKTQWPDEATGAASASQQETTTVNALGEPVTMADRNGNSHTLAYDVLGRDVGDTLTLLGVNVDGAVRRVETAYDGRGNAALSTSYSAATGGTVTSQTQRDFNGLGQLTSEWQAVGSAVTGTTPRVQYAYTEMAAGANHSRPTATTYPNGRVVTSVYAAGTDDAISRLSSLTDVSGTLESYAYLGLDTVVRRSHPLPGVDLTFIKQGAEANGSAGDQYAGLDRFGRVVDQRWIKTSTGAATDRFQYGYDRDGNRLFKDNLVSAAFGEVYAYDGLNQVASFARGTLNAGKTAVAGTPSRTQSWSPDAVGNFDTVTTNGAAQARTTNRQNEVLTVAGATSPVYDANGNLTKDETGKRYEYDGWNRPVRVKDAAGTTTLASYAYDGAGRRVTVTAGGATTQLIYSSAWQVLEERVGGVTKAQNVWSPVYVDALIERDRDADGSAGTGTGGLEERLWVQQDANYNVTALTDGTGAAVERFVYDPFGAATVLTGAFASRPASVYAWQYLHQGGRVDGASGLVHFRHRDYSPTLGRWVTMDPIGYHGGDTNLFRYVGNDPANGYDPSGLAKGKLVYPKDKSGRPQADTPIDVEIPSPAPGGKSKTITIPKGSDFPYEIDNPHAGVEGQPKKIRIIVIDGDKYPESAKHAEDSIAGGVHPGGVIDRDGSDARRKGRLKKLVPVAKKQLDEFPPAVIDNTKPPGNSKETILPIASADNQGSGSRIGQQITGPGGVDNPIIKNGDPIVIIPVKP